MDESTSGKNISNELAKERTREAADRTLMAWIRTCLALIGFGFGIAKFRDVLVEAGYHRGPEHIHSTLIFGLSFIALGIFALLAAVVQHWRILQQIKLGNFHYTGFRPVVMITALILLLIGLFAFLSIVLRL
ncbi:MAG: YidH family protein [Desulfobaccales bacterium]